jgi:WXG100 family type VII secretion target
MAQTAGRFEQASASLASMLNRLMQELEILQTQWVGAGGRSFEQVKQAWAEDQARLQRALAETANAIRTSGRVYAATDEQAAGRFTHGSVTLPL